MSYLFPFIYLYLHSITRIVIEGREVLIEKIADSPEWKLSTPILVGPEEFSKEINECLELIQQLKWENEGVFEVDGVVGTIHWTQKIHPSNFGKEFPHFLKHAQEWTEILIKASSTLNHL